MATYHASDFLSVVPLIDLSSNNLFIMFNFWFSQHRATYIKLAFRYFTTPGHVYKIAHSRAILHGRDRKIAHRLCKLGIIHRAHHSQKAQDYEMK